MINSEQLELTEDLLHILNEEGAKEAIKNFCCQLIEEASNLNQAWIDKDLEKVDFLAEKLLSSSLYFNTPNLHLLLRKILQAIKINLLTQKTLKELNQEINSILARANINQ